MRRMSAALGAALLAAVGATTGGNIGPRPSLTRQASGTTASLVGVAAVSARVAWASGRGGTFAVTTDGGERWRAGVVPGAEALQLRDVEATDSLAAWVLAIGPGDSSRIYHTTDGGRTWALQFRNGDPAAFYDCFAFWDARRAIAISDGVRGRIPILLTADGGAHWEPLDPLAQPATDSGEGSLAASGTCVVARGQSRAWIATSGGRRGSRVLATGDGGRTWSAAFTPIGAGSAKAALATLAFRDDRAGFAGGADSLGAATAEVARSSDGGRSWRLVGAPTFPGPVYGLAVVPGVRGALVAVGPAGASYSVDDGSTWATLDAGDWWSVAFTRDGVGWVVGARGAIARVSWRAAGGP